MRMEELSDSRYIKNTDQVERYLLNLVEQYCKNQNVSSPASREYIIKRAVQRMKEEISFENMGVLSITLPNGEIRTGAVTLTLDDLNGEPIIGEKKSAFNVPFGSTANTACEGNDPRLSDPRKPTEHSHQINDIIGLEGQLSTLEGVLNRTGQLEHEHDNKNVLDMLVYTGNNNVIDLTLLDTMKDSIQKLIDQIRQENVEHREEINTKITEVNTKITEVKKQIQDLKQFITDKNNEYYKKANDYTDKKISDTEKTLNSKLDNLVTKPMIQGILNIANNAYTLAGTLSFTLQQIVKNNTQEISQDIIKKVISRGATLDKCIFEISLKCFSVSGESINYTLPYLVFKDNTLCGTIQAEILRNGKIIFHINANIDDLPDSVYQGDIIINIYSTSSVSI